MDSIVLELQREAMDSDFSNVSNLLKKSLVIAKKLGIKNFEEWVNLELNGYMNNLDNIPDYREITGNLQWFNQVRGWCPAIIENPESLNSISKNKIAQSINELEYLVNSDSKELILRIPQAIQNDLARSFGIQTLFQLSISKNQIQSIIDKVGNIILDWSIQLEEDGILGEGISFSQEEKEKANQQNYIVYYNFHGETSGVQIQQHTQDSTQIQINEMDLQKVKTFISDLHEKLPQIELDEGSQSIVKKQIETINNELQEEKPKNKVIRESMKTIRSLLEGVSGNFIAQSLLYQISQFQL